MRWFRMVDLHLHAGMSQHPGIHVDSLSNETPVARQVTNTRMRVRESTSQNSLAGRMCCMSAKRNSLADSAMIIQSQARPGQLAEY